LTTQEKCLNLNIEKDTEPLSTEDDMIATKLRMKIDAEKLAAIVQRAQQFGGLSLVKFPVVTKIKLVTTYATTVETPALAYATV